MHVTFKIQYTIAEESLRFLPIIAGLALGLIGYVVISMVKKRSKASHRPDAPLGLAKIQITEARPS